MSVNVRGVMLSYKYAALQMIKQGRGGRIIGRLNVCPLMVWQTLNCIYFEVRRPLLAKQVVESSSAYQIKIY